MKNLKKIQIIFYMLSVIALVGSIIFANFNFSEYRDTEIFEKEILIKIFPVSEYLLERALVPSLIFLEVFFLMGFFLISLLIGAEILPRKLTEMEKSQVFISLNNSFNEIVFKKIYFGGLFHFHGNGGDFRGMEVSSVADLYCFHSKKFNRINILFLIFSTTVVLRIFGFQNWQKDLQLIFVFIFSNLFLFFAVDLFLYFSSKYLEGK